MTISIIDLSSRPLNVLSLAGASGPVQLRPQRHSCSCHAKWRWVVAHAAQTVVIKNFAFAPATINMHSGDQVILDFQETNHG